MSLNDIVNVTITTATRTPSQAGFGTPMIAAYHTLYNDRARIYTGIAGMLTDGFAATDPAVLAATAIFSQSPSVTQVVVGRTANDQKRSIKIAPNADNLRAAWDYEVYLEGQLRYFTTDSTPSVAEIVAGLDAALEPAAWAATHAYIVGNYVSNDTAPVKVYRCITAGTSAGSGGPTGTGAGITDNTATWEYVGPDLAVNSTATGGTYLTLQGDAIADQFQCYVEDINILSTNDVTADGTPNGIVADITAIRAINDDWYGLCMTNQGKAVITAAAAHIETLKKVMCVSSLDSDIWTSASDDLASTLETAGYARTMLIYHYKANVQFPGAAWMGKALPYEPGSITWKFKTLAGVDYMTLTPTQVAYLKAKHCNWYEQVAGISITQEGWTGAAEWMDVVNGTDFVCARMQEYIFSALANAKKVPYTDKGVGVIENPIWAVLRLAVKKDILVDDEDLTVIVPAVADVSSVDRGNRILPDCYFNGRLAGAIHSVVLSGTVSA